MAEQLTPGQHEFDAGQEQQMRRDRRKSFDPQGQSGPVNIPGRTGMGKPAQLRSENTERAQIQNSNRQMGTSRPASTLGHLLNPNQAGVQDAIYKRNKQALDATGPED